MALRITPMRPIERGGLKGFGLSVFIDNSPEGTTQFQAKASEDNGATGEATMRPADCMTGEVSRVDAGRTASATSEDGRDSVERHAPISHSSRTYSHETSNAGGVISSRPAGTLIPFAGDDRPARAKGVNYDPSTMFRQGKDTHEIAEAKGMTEAAVLKRVTLERCRRLRLPNPYGEET